MQKRTNGFISPQMSDISSQMSYFHTKLPFCQFCPSFDVFSCGVLPESGGVGTPAGTPFTMGKGLKEFQLCDSRRLRKKPQDAQDVTELFDLFDAHFWVGKVYRIGLPKAVLPSCVESLLLKQNLTLIYLRTREALLSEAGFEKVFRTQNWVRWRKLFCR